MSCTSHFSRVLRDRGFRITRQRLAVLQALHDGGHLSPAQVYERVHQTGMTEATVYRALEFLAANGILLVANRGNGHLAYELSGESHHHLVCRLCGTEVDVEFDLLAASIRRIEADTGFRLDAGHLSFVGLCPACQDHPG